MIVNMDCIFEPFVVEKKDYYDFIKNKLELKGWVNKTSNYPTDGDVFTSTGINNDMELIINICGGTGPAIPATQIQTTTGAAMGIRMQTAYTPHINAGTAGTFSRPTLAWSPLYMAPTTSMSTDVEITGYIYCDASKLIVINQYPIPTRLSPIAFFVGLPDFHFANFEKNAGMMWGATYGGIIAGNVQVCDSPKGASRSILPYNMTTIAQISKIEPSANGLRLMDGVMVDNSSEGNRVVIDGLFVTLATNMLSEFDFDYFLDPAKKFKGFICAVSTNSFPSSAIIIRVE